jgi:Protein of unknown function (DUF1203)
MTASVFVLDPIAPETADSLRAGGGPVYVADSHPGYPCRQCLRDAAVGEELVLVSHDPFAGSSPYRSASPIFLHRSPCSPAARTDDLPDQLTQRQLSVRSFDADEMMIDAAVVDGDRLRETIERFFAADQSAKIHVHNAVRGCWATTVQRVPSA